MIQLHAQKRAQAKRNLALKRCERKAKTLVVIEGTRKKVTPIVLPNMTNITGRAENIDFIAETNV